MRASETAPSMAKTSFVVFSVICGETPLSTRTPRIVPLRSTTAMMASLRLTEAAARWRRAFTSACVRSWSGLGGAVTSLGVSEGSYPIVPGGSSAEPVGDSFGASFAAGAHQGTPFQPFQDGEHGSSGGGLRPAKVAAKRDRSHHVFRLLGR